MRAVPWVLCSIAVLGSLYCLIYTFSEFRTTPETIHETAYDPYRKQALEMIRTASGGFFNLTTALLAALWAALVIPRETRLNGRDLPNLILFALANLLLIGSLFFNLRYSRLISRLYWDMGPLLAADEKFADIMNSPWVSLHQSLSQIYFFGGLVVGALSLLSTIYFGERGCVEHAA